MATAAASLAAINLLGRARGKPRSRLAVTTSFAVVVIMGVLLYPRWREGHMARGPRAVPALAASPAPGELRNPPPDQAQSFADTLARANPPQKMTPVGPNDSLDGFLSLDVAVPGGHTMVFGVEMTPDGMLLVTTSQGATRFQVRRDQVVSGFSRDAAPELDLPVVTDP